MNIFEILCAGNRVLKEEHISAVLGWMLDPYHDHGLGIELLKRLCKACFGEDAEINNVLKGGEFSGLVMRDRSRLKIHTEMECTVNTNSGKERSIDILIEINKNIVLAIENKTSPGSIQITQLKEEVEGLAEKFKNHKLYFIYLTPCDVGANAEDAMNIIDRKKCENPVHIFWKFKNNYQPKNRPSISKILNEILHDESIGETSPLASETKFLMKSFIRFIENDFSYMQGKLQSDGKYFIENAVGIVGVRNIFNIQKPLIDGPIYIGFMGGISSFEESLKKAVNNPDWQIMLENRRFKTANEKSLSGKSKANWFFIEDFIKMIDKYPFDKQVVAADDELSHVPASR